MSILSADCQRSAGSAAAVLCVLLMGQQLSYSQGLSQLAASFCTVSTALSAAQSEPRCALGQYDLPACHVVDVRT